MDDAKFRSLSALISEKFPDAKVDQIGETFGKTLQSQAVLALIFSFIAMAIVIFLAFRTFVPAVAVVLSAFADMVMTAATMNIVGIPLSLGTLAALLMLIGYSVDSDILLTNRVLKRRGTVVEKVSRAIETGVTMTSTVLVALVAMYVVSTYLYLIIPSFTQIPLLSNISIVLLAGLFADIMNTWLLNTG